MKLSTAAAASVAAMLFLAGCSSTDDTATEPTTAASTPMSSPSTSAMAPGTIVDVAAGNPDFSTLVTAVTTAGLAETLSGEGPFTVFAPTNEAFAALPDGVLDALLLPENKDALTSILTYHVVSGEVTSDMVEPGDVKTVEGSTIAIAVDDAGGVKVNDADVTAVDVDASNGVIHVIDEVLVPPTVDVAALTE